MAYSYPAYGGYNAAGAFHAQPMSFYQPIPQTPPAQPQAANQPSFSVRLVTTREEVVSAQIPFDGSTSYFVDTSNGKIYAKTFDFNTGTAPIVTYVREQEMKVQYATIDDLNALREELKIKKGVKKDDEQSA